MVLELEPYVGAGRLSFGMQPTGVEALLGAPSRALKNRKGDRVEYRDTLLLTYSQTGDGLADITLMPPASAIYKGNDLLALTDPVRFLRAFDSHPQEVVEIVVFLELGISLTGFAEPGDPQRSVGFFAKGQWDHLREKLAPLRIPGPRR